MRAIYGELADGTYDPPKEGEKEYLFRVVIVPVYALFHLGVFTGRTMEQARQKFMVSLYCSNVPVPPSNNMELWVNELLPMQIQVTE